MPEKRLVDFLKQAQKLKLNLESIGRELVKAGWAISDVDDALRSARPLRAPPAPLKAPKAPSAMSAAAKPAAKPEARPKSAEAKKEVKKTEKKIVKEKKEELPAAEKAAIEHIKKMREQGLSDEQIWAAFVDKGWKPEVIGKLLEKA